ncbi:ferredoxin--NADP reductase [Ferrimonas pelagia]|uniref:Ferredoxin--NADP reductase n=1 Tax=Ferrimonas pelagia TaxID=1177826 RepID=A0ABP9EUE6_9GAMM
MSEAQTLATAPVVEENGYYRLTVEKVIEETHDTKSVVFAIPEALKSAFQYKAGQFLTLKVPYGEQALIRCYSLASSPDTESEHKVTIKRVVDGRISNWINDQVQAGDEILVLPPAGLFHLGKESDDGDIVLFGGGSGITPVISILKTALHTTQRNIKLVYANRDDQSVVFNAELRALMQANWQRLEIVHLLDSIHGYLSGPQVTQLVAGSSNPEFFICGPGPFMDTVETALLARGEDKARIHVERFVSPQDPKEAAEIEAMAQAAAAETEASSIEVTLDDEVHQLDYEPGDTLLQTITKAGIDAPRSCEEGFCGACMCKVKRGEVTLNVNDVLSPEEVEEGWTLACQGRPMSADVSIEFPD